MFQTEIVPFTLNYDNVYYFKALETSFEPKASSTVTPSSIVSWMSYLVSIKKPLESLYSNYLMDKHIYSVNRPFTVEKVFKNAESNEFNKKTIGILNQNLDDILSKNFSFPHGLETLEGDVHFKGTPTPNVPVLLLSASDGSRLARSVSDSEGKYSFRGVRKDREYIVLAIDPTKEYSCVGQEVKI